MFEPGRSIRPRQYMLASSFLQKSSLTWKNTGSKSNHAVAMHTLFVIRTPVPVYRDATRTHSSRVCEKVRWVVMKLPLFRSARKVHRAVCIVCMPFVLAWIAFTVLDLDGSNLISFSRNLRPSLIDADVAEAPRTEPLLERVEFLDDRRIPLDGSSLPSHFKLVAPRALTRLEKARTHLYHISLPRDAVPG